MISLILNWQTFFISLPEAHRAYLVEGRAPQHRSSILYTISFVLYALNDSIDRKSPGLYRG